ncbi:hypothetical protein [Burkholderia gladioli]|uniref:hypothetical protein n=1 Tax=Burkholderia gladioli TaxID=28095 RepID=UPI0016402E5F|nr:hypothetical protein [Burkholderia gladioli]
MSDKLSDKQILKLAEKHHALHPGVDEWWEFRDREDLLAFARDLESLAASPAPAIPAVDPVEIIEQCATLADSMAAQGYPANVIGRDIRALKAAPAISESEDARDAAIDRYQAICAAAYQLAGVVGAPLRFLDALSEAANGEPMSTDDALNLLPVGLDEFDEVNHAAIDAARAGGKS